MILRLIRKRRNKPMVSEARKKQMETWKHEDYDTAQAAFLEMMGEPSDEELLRLGDILDKRGKVVPENILKLRRKRKDKTDLWHCKE